MDYHECEECDEDGFVDHDCGEDTCSCCDPEPNVVCERCGGRGGWWRCMSSPGWCEGHPLPGREKVFRSTIINNRNGAPLKKEGA
jgi:hypothetical protein